MFEHIAVDFASASPPTDPVLALYGGKFADWLLDQRWIADLPYLPDVARIDRLHVSSLFAPDEERPSIEHAAQLSRLPSTGLRLHPAARFAWLSTPAMSIWLAHQGRTTTEIAPEWKGEGALFARPEPLYILTRRSSAAPPTGFSPAFGWAKRSESSLAAATKLYPEEDCAAVFASLVTLGVFVAPTQRRN